jgi:hypothetical protein
MKKILIKKLQNKKATKTMEIKFDRKKPKDKICKKRKTIKKMIPN